jgi:hypothetical protein
MAAAGNLNHPARIQEETTMRVNTLFIPPILLIVISLLASNAAFARGHGGGGRHGGSVGFYFGSPFFGYGFSPFYNYPPYYYSPPVIIQQTPPVYIEQNTRQPGQPYESNGWDYCPGSNSYYPHVSECPAGWQRIEPQPEGQKPGYWYYCNSPAGYYPYVPHCTTPWQAVNPE